METKESNKHELADFRNLVFLAWKHLRLPCPTPIQYDIASWIQHGPRRMLIMGYRGVGKSWLTSVFACHQLLMNPNINVLVISASKTRADDFSTFTLRLIEEMPSLRHLKPRDDQRSSKIAFDVSPAMASHAPSCRSLGATSAITGSRADLLIADDIENLGNSMTSGQRDKMSELIKEYDAVLKPNGRIIFLGTPQVDAGSIYSILPSRGYEPRIWPARFPSPATAATKYEGKLAPFITGKLTEGRTGTPTDPDRFDADDLAEREASFGRAGFALQFMLDTSLTDELRFPLRLEDLSVMDLDPELGPEKVIRATSPELALEELPNVGFAGDRWYRPMKIQGDMVPYQGCVMAIDPAGRGRDECSWAVVKMINSQLFLVDSGGLQAGYVDSTLQHLAEVAKKHKVNYIIQESNFGGGMATKLLMPWLRKIWPCTVEEVTHTKTKEFRMADVLEPLANQGKLIIDRKVIEVDFRSTQDKPGEDGNRYQLWYQYTRLSRDRGCLKYDDRLDAMAMACQYWVDQMSRDADDAMDERQTELLMRDLERWKEQPNVYDGFKPPPKPSWLNIG